MEDFRKRRNSEAERTDVLGSGQPQEHNNAENDEQQGNPMTYNVDEYDSYSPWG